MRSCARRQEFGIRSIRRPDFPPRTSDCQRIDSHPADYDGEGKTGVAVFRDGNWYRINSSNNQFVAAQFGANGNVSSAADYDGDARVDIAVFRPSNGAWYLLRSTAGFTGV